MRNEYFTGLLFRTVHFLFDISHTHNTHTHTHTHTLTCLVLDKILCLHCEAFPDSSVGKNPPAMQDTLVQLLGWEDPLEKA